ncbi:dihydropteroate synthase [Acidiferrobacter thiooxydans]|nr:dihydropteroate synthase [Acidiferrobacter thiooxydans]MDA8190877.1 dihydropteroate synthase [Gammaproteobacteria bacterium]UEN99137.1 dihydropteroate synthase [Acidiferrobacter thiooxydans]
MAQTRKAAASWLRTDGRVAIMGILNVTPDSFSDGGLFLSPDNALRHAEALIEAGADIIDVGGESTRPGARPVSPDEECARVIPVVAALQARFPVPLSVDTSEPQVMREAVAAGASFINDVRALTRPGALATAADLGVPVCLMHEPAGSSMMGTRMAGRDVVAEVLRYLEVRLQAAQDAGIPRSRILIDPGFGFGKDLAENQALLRALPRIAALSPVLVGLSRKRMTGEPWDLPVDGRLHTSLALALAAIAGGARVVRVHDVRATREAVRAWEWVFEPKEWVA